MLTGVPVRSSSNRNLAFQMLEDSCCWQASLALAPRRSGGGLDVYGADLSGRGGANAPQEERETPLRAPCIAMRADRCKTPPGVFTAPRRPVCSPWVLSMPSHDATLLQGHHSAVTLIQRICSSSAQRRGRRRRVAVAQQTTTSSERFLSLLMILLHLHTEPG